jgi:hypothetical protein
MAIFIACNNLKHSIAFRNFRDFISFMQGRGIQPRLFPLKSCSGIKDKCHMLIC